MQGEELRGATATDLVPGKGLPECALLKRSPVTGWTGSGGLAALLGAVARPSLVLTYGGVGAEMH
ncbi:hypothetical protein trd_A0876 (plasmid) [Thermomicrobium roseum DSM 5159]|uniref:Uncharacterized protein n=1 Tax=Thermomicrobium roseum (strain ATCC 27502 / DSM 5159 / P-2) TaxID=309801 RepID=B9L512_THERP|nr:hypothetical protein trd_A0876 [Thermomicrobium roseum DSM 5159]